MITERLCVLAADPSILKRGYRHLAAAVQMEGRISRHQAGHQLGVMVEASLTVRP
jgi:hypothetical protein